MNDNDSSKISTPSADTRQERSTAAKTVAITTAVIGAFTLVGVGGSAAVATAGSVWSVADGGDSAQSLDTSGITELDVNASATQLTVEFGNVSEATLEAHGTNWQFDRNGETLVVDQRRGPFGGWCFIFCNAGSDSAVLTLPDTLNGSLDAEAEVGAGALRIDGAFRSLDVRVGAGEAIAFGEAETLNVTVETGRADVSLRDVETADISVSVGTADVALTGSTPALVDVDVSVGDATVTLPDALYSLSRDASVGSIDSTLRTDPSSPHVVDAEVSVGSIILRAE
ncbi:DUF4097 family beta strand repeat-containing protein [uncultured Agrococcus sp.]|uniref:DUF4097 family beta strand repeat-containing protein n=1 Tax=uncultured Agrococcus sp. TaxID=382258 RepID=UPI0025E722FE|nr:DUF4097 family beta strand repeat-containing protein [uncultured Agrococcus sp.]